MSPGFAEVAERLHGNGYTPIPVVLGQKRPAITDWTNVNYEGSPGCCQTNANSSLCGMNVVILCSTKLTPLGESSVALKFEIIS